MDQKYRFLEFRNGDGVPYLVGTRIRASIIGMDYNTWGYKNPEDLAKDRDLDPRAVREALEWHRENSELVTRVCAEERRQAGLKD